MLATLLVVTLALLLLGALPVWPYSRNWGYGGSGVYGVLLVMVAVAALIGWL